MSNIRIETLWPVHIGNGMFLLQGNDFIFTKKKSGESVIDVLSEEKLGRIVGTSPTTISQWVEEINKNNADDFIKSRLKGHSSQEYAKRRIYNYASIPKWQTTLKECIHDGQGRPFIPGSSIKGAIRTAVMAKIARERILNDLDGSDLIEDKEKILSSMEKRILGETISQNVFRYLSTGDIYFNPGVEIAVTQINLNIREQDSLLDYKKQQIVEVISANQCSNFRINAKHEFFECLKIKGMNGLFQLINEHTKRLVKEDIHFWTQGEGGDYEGQDDYLENLRWILEDISDCGPNECVLRLGQGVGWRFITGAWTEHIDCFDELVVPKSRPKNYNYSQYPFPKSRRISKDSEIFGFVKLTIQD